MSSLKHQILFSDNSYKTNTWYLFMDHLLSHGLYQPSVKVKTIAKYIFQVFGALD